MTLQLIAAMTLVALVILNAWFSERRLVISRTGDVFMLAWFYYGFAIAFDVLLGLDVQGIPGMTDFSDDTSRELLVHVLTYYLLCGGAFFIAYSSTRKAPRSARATSSAVLPPIPVIIAAHVVLLLLLAHAGYFGLTRPQRILLISDSLSLRLTVHWMAILRAVDLLVIILSDRKSYVMGTAVAAICLGLASGGRMELMSIVLILVLKHRFSCGRLKFVSAIVVLLMVFASWKSAYQYVHNRYFEPGTNRQVLEFVSTSLSGIDSYASSLIAVTALQNDCPYHVGKTYIYDAVQATLPREWRAPAFLPLSQQFDWDYLPHRAEEGISMAFSAIAESWLNFGIVGPVLLGIAFGVAAKKIDTRPRGIVFYIFALLAFRLFRSDFASLCKNWIVIYGGAMVACHGACMFMAGLLDSRRRTDRAVCRLEQSASAGRHAADRIGRRALARGFETGSKVSSHAS